MNDQDSTEKNAKILSDPKDVATSRIDTATTKELTDEQFSAVVGGATGKHIDVLIKK